MIITINKYVNKKNIKKAIPHVLDVAIPGAFSYVMDNPYEMREFEGK